MPKDTRYRVKLTFSGDEQGPVEELCNSWSRWLPPATSLRQIILLLAENPGAIQKVGTPGAQTTPDDPRVTQPGPGPGPTLASPLKNPDPEEEKRRKKEGEQKGESEGGTRLAPLDVAERIVSDLNEQTGSTSRANGKIIRGMIQARLNDGWTEADFYEVHRKKTLEWKSDQRMERFLRFKTLYSPTNFESYVGQPDVSPQRGLAFTEGEKRRERHRKRAATKHQDRNIREDLPDAKI